MLVVRPWKRMNADDLVRDKWINSAHQNYRSLSRAFITQAFNNMKCFRIVYQLQRAALMHMAKTSIPKKEKDNLKMIYDAIDEEKDGELELSELVI